MRSSWRNLLSPFSRLFFYLCRQEVAVSVLCFCAYQYYLRMSLVSRYPAVLQGGWLHFSRMSSRFTAPRLAGIFSTSIFQQTFYFVQKFPPFKPATFMAAHIRQAKQHPSLCHPPWPPQHPKHGGCGVAATLHPT